MYFNRKRSDVRLDMISRDEQGEIAHKSMTSRTHERLSNAIITARFRPGEKLKIEALTDEFDASLGAVREALARLTSEGLVSARPQRGFFVALISRRDLIDLTETRIEIEQTCLASSITHGDLTWEGRVLSIGHQLSKLSVGLHDRGGNDSNEWHKYHQRFHEEITAACANSWWLKLRQQLFIQSERYRRLSGPLNENGRDIDAEHRAIMESVLARDITTARALLA
ncbi:GntR family transcriptional regulator, partial [Mesorhizobium sp. M7A.F.Ca.US.006.01.1.1]